MATKQNYFTKQGNDFLFNLAFTDSNKVAIDLAGYTILFTAKPDKNFLDTDPSCIKVTGVINNDPTTGLARL